MSCGVIPILFGWFLRVPSLHACACFHSENFFCDLFLLLFFYCFLEIVREKRGRQGQDAWSVNYESIELCCSQRTKNHHKSNASK